MKEVCLFFYTEEYNIEYKLLLFLPFSPRHNEADRKVIT